MRITTTAEELRVLLATSELFVSRDSKHPSLHVVILERHKGKVLAASTDRFRFALTAIEADFDHVPEDWRIALDVADIRTLTTSLKSLGGVRQRRQIETTIHDQDGKLTVSTPTAEWTFDRAENQVPDWRGLFSATPSASGGVPALVNPGLLADAARAARGSKDMALIELSANSTRPARITIGDHTTILLMPVGPTRENTVGRRLHKELGIECQ
ncbi:hypothetical protein AB4Z09_26340 [Rhodococcus sp. TAF43]|uniref:hypothetical protein n=1 Tax=unclassified Rhodococcus (in: high G+C Gram-positive bacteria) TaxID=192944 RepID=UPI001581C608|nr:hypothetical protein [Rhodococcus sp. W8901]QKT10419.1 hypothetical protein HUN07_06540 [Rhodococcus sp. W8901]